ncbi:MAG: AMP-binding protein [Prevotella sp.]|nr:AMP-binding protein [Prevotella sp.]
MKLNFYNQVLTPVLESISKYPHRNAFCIDETYYTYEMFSRRISAISEALDTCTFSKQQIGLVINDDLDTYASIFALWLKGLCYVPLHPGWPLDRCVEICNQVGLDLILDSTKTTRYSDGQNVLMTFGLQDSEKPYNTTVNVGEDELAYILFTSGSTGKPKGVQLMRKNVAAFMDSFWKTGITISEEDHCLQAFDLSFDVSVQSYLVALTRGACIYTIPHGQVKYVYASGLIEDHHITFGAMAPSMLRYLQPYFAEMDATSLKVCILTAEACPVNLMEDWYNCATNTDIYDFYGPTEATIYCTYYKLTRGGENKSLNGIISIGKPLANCIGLILDEQGNELPAGEKGELCIAGDQVTKGYWYNPEKNKTSFFYKEVEGIKMRFYHTGDLCYKDEDGDIMYSGRMDHQAKIQGFRVELGEIEYHAREFLKKNVVCIAFDNEKSLTEIVMFIESNEFDTEELLAYMRTKMPSYMIPTRLFFVPVFPLNSNDKTDKVKLKEMIR